MFQTYKVTFKSNIKKVVVEVIVEYDKAKYYVKNGTNFLSS